MVRLSDRPDMTLDVYRGRKTTKQQQQIFTAAGVVPCGGRKTSLRTSSAAGVVCWA